MRHGLLGTWFVDLATGPACLPAADSSLSLWVVSRLIPLFSWLGTIVADPCQGHRLTASGTESAGPAVLPVVAATVARSMTSLDAGLAGAQGLHLFLSGQLRSAQDGTVSPFKVAAIGVMSESWLGSCGRAVKVHRVDHVPNIWMLHRARHENTLGAGRAGGIGPAGWPAERPDLPRVGRSNP
jgi:hypothetical protein